MDQVSILWKVLIKLKTANENHILDTRWHRQISCSEWSFNFQTHFIVFFGQSIEWIDDSSNTQISLWMFWKALKLKIFKLSFQNESNLLTLISLLWVPLSNICIYQSLSFVYAKKWKKKMLPCVLLKTEWSIPKTDF